MVRCFRLASSVVVVTTLACLSLVGLVASPAGADVEGYTVQLTETGGESGIGCRLARVNLTTGALTPIGAYLDFATFACASDLAFSPSGVLYGISDDPAALDLSQSESGLFDPEPTGPGGASPAAPAELHVHLVRFDTGSGAVTDLGAIGTAASEIGLQYGSGGATFDAAGNLFVYMVGEDPSCDGRAFCLYKVDPAAPANATFVGDDPQQTYLYGLAATCAGRVVTVQGTEAAESAINPATLIAPAGDTLDTVDTTLGKATPVGPAFGQDRTVQSLDFDAGGTLWAIGSTIPKGTFSPAYVGTIDPATGSLTFTQQIDPGPEESLIFGLAVAPLSCQQPEVVEVTPKFTG